MISTEPDCRCIDWKLCVSVPDRKKCGNEKHFIDWLRAKLCKDSKRDQILEEIPSFEVME